GLYIAVEATFRFLKTCGHIEAEFHFLFAIGECQFFVCVGYCITEVCYYLAVIAPLVYAHFLAYEIHVWRRAYIHVLLLTCEVNGDSSLVAMRYGGDHVFWPERRIAAEEYFLIGRNESSWVHNRHVPFVEVDTKVA